MDMRITENITLTVNASQVKASSLGITCITSDASGLVVFATAEEIRISEYKNGTLEFMTALRVANIRSILIRETMIYAASSNNLYIIQKVDGCLKIIAQGEVANARGLIQAFDYIWIYGDKGLFGRIERVSVIPAISFIIRSDFLSACRCAQFIVLGTSDGKIFLFNPREEASKSVIFHHNRMFPSRLNKVMSLCSLNDEDGLLMVGDGNGEACKYNIFEPHLLPIQILLLGPSPLIALIRHRPNSIVCVTSRGNVWLVRDSGLQFIKKSNFQVFQEITCGTCLNNGAVLLATQFGSIDIIHP